MPEIPEALQQWLPFLTSVLQAIVILVVGWIAAGMAGGVVKRAMAKRSVDEAVSGFIAQLTRWGFVAAALIASLQCVGVETTSFVALLGSAGLAIGLGMQGNLSHFASGVMILVFKPFRVGDVITAGGHTGGVVEIGLFATTMHTPDNLKIIVPNGAITGGSVVNTTVLGTRRASIAVGVAYGTDVAQVIEILKGAAAKADLVLEDPGPAVAFVGLGASSIDFLVHCWSASDPDSWLGMQHNVTKACYEALNAAGIDIPYNQIVVHQAS